jgi:tetratricopeptide (TPR) repeat protein
MLGAVTLMHRATQSEFRRARTLLDHLINLHSQHAQPFSWLGKWYVIQTAQGWSIDPVRDANEALGFCQRALDFDSQSALALAVTGQVHGYLKKDLSTAETMYRKAIEINPNESLAWLWLGMTAGFRGEGETAMSATEHALSLSPLDPIRYYYLSLASSAALTGGNYPRAIELARQSLRANRSHSSTYRSLAIAQVLSGKVSDAKTTVTQLLHLEPGFTVRTFLNRHPGREVAEPFVNMLASALVTAGLPS